MTRNFGMWLGRNMAWWAKFSNLSNSTGSWYHTIKWTGEWNKTTRIQGVINLPALRKINNNLCGVLKVPGRPVYGWEGVALNVNWVNVLLPTGMRLRGQLLRACNCLCPPTTPLSTTKSWPFLCCSGLLWIISPWCHIFEKQSLLMDVNKTILDLKEKPRIHFFNSISARYHCVLFCVIFVVILLAVLIEWWMKNAIRFYC